MPASISARRRTPTGPRRGRAWAAASGSSSIRQCSRSAKRSGVMGGTMILRFERISTAPSAARRLRASRTGIWLTPSSAARPRVESPTPGTILPVISRRRSSS